MHTPSTPTINQTSNSTANINTTKAGDSKPATFTSDKKIIDDVLESITDEKSGTTCCGCCDAPSNQF